MIVTNSMLKTYLRCRRQFWYKFQKQLVPVKEGALPLKRGSWLHALLEEMYKGGDWRTVHETLTADFNRMFVEEREYYGDLPTHCFRIMRAYEYFWRDADREFEVLEVEKTFDVPLPHGHTYRFRLDGLVADGYGTWIFEHKSHLSIPRSDYRFIDPQSARYFWGLENLGVPITGILWNYLSTLSLSTPQLTATGRLSRRKIRTDPFTYVEGLKSLGIDPADYKSDIIKVKQRLPELYRRERVPKPPKVAERLVEEMVYVADEIERGIKPIRTIERSCETQCSFLPLCLTSLYGGDSDQIRSTQYRKATASDYYAFEEKALK